MTPDLYRADAEFIRHADGLFVGQLDGAELAAFDRLCEAGQARRSYEGAGGFMGLARVRLETVAP